MTAFISSLPYVPRVSSVICISMFRQIQPLLRVPTLYCWTETPTWVGLNLNSITDPIQQLIKFTLAHYTPILLHFVQHVWCTRTNPHSTSFCQDDMYLRYSHTYSLFCTDVSKLLTNMSRRCMNTCERTSYYTISKNVIFIKKHTFISETYHHPLTWCNASAHQFCQHSLRDDQFSARP
jgi:hypothetical protein